MSRVLVAGVGNLFCADDGFGCEVARRLAAQPRLEGVAVADYGIRGMHLAYELSSGGYDLAIIVDAVSRGGRAGTLYLIDLDVDGGEAVVADAHGVDLGAVFAMTRRLGLPPARMVVVGCEAGELVERIGLSEPIAQAIEPAIGLIRSLLRDGARAVEGEAR